jgi:DNA-binding FrmR family transcriptional regulator
MAVLDTDILQQSSAVQKSLSQIDNLILENHLKTCASDAIKSGDSEKAITEIMQVFKKNAI